MQTFFNSARLARARVPLALMVGLVVGLSGCASLSSKPEDRVKALAEQRWSHLIAGEFGKAYEMATPGYRKLRDEKYYRDRRGMTPVKWISAEVLRVSCEPAGHPQPTKCQVRIKLDSRAMVPMAPKGIISSGLDETWLYEDGKWWMLEAL